MDKASLEASSIMTEDRTAWRKISCTAGPVNVRNDNADESKESKLACGMWIGGYSENELTQACCKHEC